MADQLNTTTSPVMLTDSKVQGLKAPPKGRVEHRDAKVTGLRLRIGSTGKKTWVLRARAGAKVVNRKLGVFPGMGLATARAAAEKALATLSRDKSTAAFDRTFQEVGEAWIESVKKKNRIWNQQERRLEMYVYPAWAKRPIIDITRTDVRQLIDNIPGETVPNMILATIRPVFRFALSRDWITVSPAEGIPKPHENKARERYLVMPEVARIWQAAELLGYPFGSFLKVLMLTGQRRTEVASMRWKDVDLEAKVWSMSAEQTKSKRAQLVPLSPPVLDLFKGLPRFGEYVFSTNGSTHMSGFDKVKKRLDGLIGSIGDEPMAEWRFHDLRRTTATHMTRLGILEEVVSKVLNHASQGVTGRVYNVWSYEPEKRVALGRWAAEVMAATSPKVEG